LTDSERFRLNHPDSVLRKWRVPDPTKGRKSAVGKLKESVASLEEQNHQLRRDLERGRAAWEPHGSAEEIARVLVNTLSPINARRVALATIDLLDQANQVGT